MPGEWKVASDIFFDRKMYIVYRIRDVNKTDHSGNRECSGGYVGRREEAEEHAAELNRQEGR